MFSPLPPLILWRGRFHDAGPHCIDIWPNDILFVATASSVVSGPQLGRCISASNFGVYGSNILIFPHRWMNKDMAPIHRISTRITINASSGRTTILLAVKGRREIESQHENGPNKSLQCDLFLPHHCFFFFLLSVYAYHCVSSLNVLNWESFL